MLIELFIFYEIIVIGLFFFAFFSHNEIIWFLTAVFGGILMFSSYNIEVNMYVINTTLGAYQPAVISYSYPYLMGINLLFFALALILGLFDMFDKYGVKVFKKNE